MLKKSAVILLIFTIFGAMNLMAKIPQKKIDRLLRIENRLSKKALHAYLRGKDIKRYLKDLKEINRHIMEMVKNNSDIKHIIEYLDMEIDRVNLVYDRDSLLRLHQEIAESRRYIKLATRERIN